MRTICQIVGAAVILGFAVLMIGLATAAGHADERLGQK